MKLHDHPDPRLTSPNDPVINEPSNVEEPFRNDWLNLAIKLGVNIEDTLFQAFGGAI